MTGYTRKDTGNSIALGNIIDPDIIDEEYDGIEEAFNASAGHAHDGSPGEGAPILVTGPAQEYLSGPSDFSPKADSVYSLGTVSVRWANGFFDNLDTVDLSVSGSVGFSDSGFSIQNQADNTKTIKFDVSGVTTGTTKTLTVPDYDATLATLSGTETFTNKTLTSPIINTATIAGGSVSGATVTTTSISGGTITAANISGASISGGTVSGAAITGGSVSGITDLAVADGGTGASTASDARTNLGLQFGATADLATQLEAEAGTDNTKVMSPLRVSQAISANTPKDIQEFTSSGTWTKPEGATFVQVYAVGPGGGGSNDTGTTTSNGGGGGEGVIFTLLASDLGATESVVIGVGGAGAPSGANAEGSDGGNTTFGPVTAYGGARGRRGTTKSLSARVNVGASGSPTYTALYGVSGLPSVFGGGGGGGAFFGSAALGAESEFGGTGGDGNDTASTKAGNGTTPGGGGGGSTNDGGGGDGGDGYCRVISW